MRLEAVHVANAKWPQEATASTLKDMSLKDMSLKDMSLKDMSLDRIALG